MEQYLAWKDLLRAGEATGWQQFYVKFYQAFIDGSRWKQYLSGVGTTLMVTAMALAIGIVLGILVAMVRTAHDQQRAGKHNPVLGVLNERPFGPCFNTRVDINKLEAAILTFMDDEEAKEKNATAKQAS